MSSDAAAPSPFGQTARRPIRRAEAVGPKLVGVLRALLGAEQAKLLVHEEQAEEFAALAKKFLSAAFAMAAAR